MEDAHPPHKPPGHSTTIDLRGIQFDVLEERQVVEKVVRSLGSDSPGWIVTANIDIMRICSVDPVAAALVQQATCVVADGMPVLWAARIAGTPLPERVTGSSLIFSVSAALAKQGGSVFLIGGEPGVPDRAAENLVRRFEGLRSLGADSPPFGFERDPSAILDIVDRVRDADPDVVYVGLGFPKQERLIATLSEACPRPCYIGCGAALAMAAGAVSRAPTWAQRWGMEWLYRLAMEPRRLAQRYLVDDLPYACGLLAEATWRRIAARRHSTGGYSPDSTTGNPIP